LSDAGANVLAVSPNGTGGANLFVGTSVNGTYLSTDNGTSWSQVNNGLTNMQIRALAVSGPNLFAGTVGGGMFISSNNGMNWTAVNNGLTNLVVQALAVSGQSLFAGTYHAGVFVSTNNGTNWTAANNGLPADTYLSSLVASGTNIFAGISYTAGGYAYGGVFLSTNNGTSWTAVNTGLPSGSARDCFLGVNGANLFAGISTSDVNGSRIYRSTNNGSNWTAVNTGLPSSATRYCFAASSGNLFAGIDTSGVFLSTNNGTSWTEVNNGLTYRGVRDLAVSPGASGFGANLIAVGGGVWRRPLSDMITSVDKPSNGLPMHFNLDQNYPNPFNPTTIINYAVPQSSNVSIRIFNTLGQEVAELVSEFKAPGYYQVQWNANVPSGIYFYRLQAGDFIKTKKLVLLK